MVGVIVNTATVLLGSLVGILFRKGIPKRLADALLIGIGLCSLYIGISNALKGSNTIILILSVVIGAVIGTLIDLDRRITSFADRLGKKTKQDSNSRFSEGFITASLVFCVGAMTIVGSLQSGLTGNNEMIYTKSVLDFISAIVFASTMGIGVIFSAVFVFVFQGAIVLLAGYVTPFLGDTVIAEMTCAGAVLIIGLGLNLCGITKIKIANYLPAILIPILLCPLYDWVSSLISAL